MSLPILSDAASVALSMAQLGAAVWSSMQEAERALSAFSAAQGWSLVVRKSSKLQYTYLDTHGEKRPGELDLNKVWICSRGHGRESNESHICAADETACEAINATGQLALPSPQLPRLSASAKTGCSVFARVSMMKKAAPANGCSNWTETDSPCAGYKLFTDVSALLPCRHNHSSLHAAEGSVSLVESVGDIPPAVRAEIASLVLASFPSYRIRAYISSKHSLPHMVPAVWTTLIRSIKTELGIQDAGQDLKTLIERFTTERNESGAVFDFAVDGDLAVSSIFFMSRAMVESFRRCAQFAVMDSTCKTNRFGMNLFLVCGVDEHQHIALYASAFMKDETQPSFEYVLTQLKRAVGLDAWMRMSCVATDGCAAMTSALKKIAPHAEQQRCVWHLQQNIIKHTSGSSHQHLIKAWYQCVYAKTLAEFDARWQEMLLVKMTDRCREYLLKYILPLQSKWSCYATGHLTNFGSHSTQLVESLNRVLKMWDVNDRASLSQAVERICTVKAEEETRRQITAMRDHSMLAVEAGSTAAAIQVYETYKVKVKKVLTGTAAMLCEKQYDLYSQYRVTLVVHGAGKLFSLATRTYTVEHKVTASSQYQVHVSPFLIYCPCGDCTTYLLPCRHVLAANGAAFDDIFQPGQYHPRWWMHYNLDLQQDLLSKQFWIHVGKEVTAAGLHRAHYWPATAEESKHQEADEQAGEHGSEPAAAAASSSELCPVLPYPMYPPSMQQLMPAQLTPQHLYHLIEGECQTLRQLACTNPALLSGMVWMGLSQLKMQVTAHIDREQRTQGHHAAMAAATAAAPSAFTSQGVSLTSLLAPVPLTATKPGRPSSKRARAAMEGVVSRKVRAMLPGHLLGDGGAAAEERAVAGAGQGQSSHAEVSMLHVQPAPRLLAAPGVASITAGVGHAVPAAVQVPVQVAAASPSSRSGRPLVGHPKFR